MALNDLPHLERTYRLARLCELAYDLSSVQEEGGLKITPFHYALSLDGTPLGISGFVAGSAADLVLAFCGSKLSAKELLETLANWTINLAARQVTGYGGKVHRGFAFAIDNIWEDVLGRVKAGRTSKEQQLWLCGHSLGGALATLAACRLANSGHPPAAVFTFGSPRVGDRAFAEHYALPHFRFENQNDVVAFLCPPPDDFPLLLRNLAQWVVQQVLQTNLPESVFNYRHVEKCQFLDWDGSLRTCPADFFPERMQHLGDAIRDHKITSYLQGLAHRLGRQK